MAQSRVMQSMQPVRWRKITYTGSGIEVEMIVESWTTPGNV